MIRYVYSVHGSDNAGGLGPRRDGGSRLGRSHDRGDLRRGLGRQDDFRSASLVRDASTVYALPGVNALPPGGASLLEDV